MADQNLPDRLIEYFCSVGVGDTITPMNIDGHDPHLPIYDVCIIYGKDEPPSGYEKIEQCYYGESANLNAAIVNMFSSPSIFLCCSRKTRKQRQQHRDKTKDQSTATDDTSRYQPDTDAAIEPTPTTSPSFIPSVSPPDDSNAPIVDLIVLYPERGDKCPPAYTPVPVYSAPNKYSPYYKAMVIAYSRSTTRPPLLNIILCIGSSSSTGSSPSLAPSTASSASSASASTLSSSTSSSSLSQHSAASSLTPPAYCRCPPFYSLVKKSVNMGTYHEGMYLAVLLQPSTLASLPIRPTLIDRLPRADLPASPLPDSLPLFCFPEGLLITEGSRPPVPTVGSFVLTIPSGVQLHCAMVCFYEKIKVDCDYNKSMMTSASPPRTRRMSSLPGSPMNYRSSESLHTYLNTAAFPHFRLATQPAHHYRFAPKAIVIASYWPFYHCFHQFLVELYKIVAYSSNASTLALLVQQQLSGNHNGAPATATTSSSSNYFVFPSTVTNSSSSYIRASSVPIERYLMNLWETPLPRPSRVPVQLMMATHPIVFESPSHTEFPLANYSFVPLFSHLSTSNIITILSAMINEKKIILSSKHLALLTPIGEALRSLIFPLQWTSPFVPIVPALSTGILDAPMPIFAGVDSHYTQNRLTYTEDVCLVKVDEDEVKMYGKVVNIHETLANKLRKDLVEYAHIDSIRDSDHAHDGDHYGQDHDDGAFDYIPQAINHSAQQQRQKQEMIKAALLKAANPTLTVSTSSSNMAAMLSSAAGGSQQSGMGSGLSSMFNVVACRAAFLQVFISLLSTVDEYLLFPPVTQDREPSFDQLFDLQSWLNAPTSRYHKPLLKVLSATQLFTHYIEEKTYSASSLRKLQLEFFDRCCMYDREHHLTLDKNKATGKASQHIHHPNLILYLSQRKAQTGFYCVPPPDVTGLDPNTVYSYALFPVIDVTLLRKPRPVVLKYMRDASNITQQASNGDTDDYARLWGDGGKRGEALPVSHHHHHHLHRGRASALASSLSVVKITSPTVFAKFLLREVYAVWFELWLICLPYHPSVQEGILEVWNALARMTSQNVSPDEGIFRSVLAICGRWRKKDAAASIFETMKKNGVKPTSVTYGAYTSALAEASNIEADEEESQNSEDRISSGSDSLESTGSATQDPFGLVSPSSLMSASASRPVPHSYPSLQSLSLDPYRQAEDKHTRLIMKAQRQQVLWSSLGMCVSNVCSCGYEMSEAEVICCWMSDLYSSSAMLCTSCRTPFHPILRIVVTIVTNPPRLKQILFQHHFKRRLGAYHRRYHITVPLLSPTALRKDFLTTSAAFRDDFTNRNTFRVMHEVLYWNLLFQLSHPYNRWDLTFLVNLSPAELQKYRVQRLYRSDRTGGFDCYERHGAVNEARKKLIHVSNRTIEGSEGLRSRDPQLMGPLSPASTISPPSESLSITPHQHPLLHRTDSDQKLTKHELRNKYRLEADSDEEKESELSIDAPTNGHHPSLPNQPLLHHNEHKERPVVEGWVTQPNKVIISPSTETEMSSAGSINSFPTRSYSAHSSTNRSPSLSAASAAAGGVAPLSVDVEASPPLGPGPGYSSMNPSPVLTPSSSNGPGLSLVCPSHHDDAPVEREIARYLSKQKIAQAMECFLKHRMRMRAEQEYSSNRLTATPTHQHRTDSITLGTPSTLNQRMLQADSPKFEDRASSSSSTSSASTASFSALQSTAPPARRGPGADASGPSKPLLVKKSRLSSIIPSRHHHLEDAVHSANAAFSFSEENTPESPLPVSRLPRKRSMSLCKSHSSNEVDALGHQSSALAVVTGMAMSAMKDGYMDHSPSNKELGASPALSSSTTSSHSVAASSSSASISGVPTSYNQEAQSATDGMVVVAAERHWYPIRHAAPQSRLYNRCMFECFVILGLKYYDHYHALIEAFTASVNKLSPALMPEITPMDIAPSPTVAAVEIILGIKKIMERKKPKDKAQALDATPNATPNATPEHTKKKHTAATAASPALPPTTTKKPASKPLDTADDDSGAPRHIAALVKSMSSPLRASANGSPTVAAAATPPSPAPSTPTRGAAVPDAKHPPSNTPVALSFPIAFPVTVAAGAALSSAPSPLLLHSPAPSLSPPLMLLRSPGSTTEEYVGTISDFVGPNPDYRGLTPGLTPSAASASEPAFTPTPARSRGGRARHNTHSPLPPLAVSPTSPASPASSSSASTPGEREAPELQVVTEADEASCAFSHSYTAGPALLPSVASPPLLVHKRQTSEGVVGSATGGRERALRKKRGSRQSPASASGKAASASLSSPASPAVSPRQRAAFSVGETGRQVRARAEAVISPSRPVRATSQTSIGAAHGQGGGMAVMARTVSSSSSSSSGGSIGIGAGGGGGGGGGRGVGGPAPAPVHAASGPVSVGGEKQHKTFTQSLYQFLMTKPTGAAAAAAAGAGYASSASFTAGQGTRAPSGSKKPKPSSSPSVELPKKPS